MATVDERNKPIRDVIGQQATGTVDLGEGKYTPTNQTVQDQELFDPEKSEYYISGGKQRLINPQTGETTTDLPISQAPIAAQPAPPDTKDPARYDATKVGPLGTIDPAWQKIPYRGDVNPMLMGAYGDAARNALGILTRPLPVKEGKLFGAFPIKGYERPAVSPETRRELKAYAGIQKQISGIGGGKFKNRLQKEITRLNINRPWEKFKRYKATI